MKIRSPRFHIIGFFILITVVACTNGHTTTSVTSETEMFTTYPASITPLPSKTNTPSSILSETPSVTPLPPYTYSLNLLQWPESGDLILPMDGESVFQTPIQDLPSGSYLVYLNEDKHEIWYASLETDNTGVLLHLGDELDLPDGIVSGPGRFLLYDRARVWRFYDLVDQSARRVGPICLWEQVTLSPSGNWIGILCEGVQSGENSEELMTLEIISTYQGTGSRILIPRATSGQDTINPFLFWLDDDTLGISRVWMADEFHTCRVSFLEELMFCPLVFNPGYLARQMTIVPGGDTIPFTDIKSFPWRSALVPMDCLVNGKRCSEIVELDEIVGVPYATPDPDLFWWISPLDITEITRIGVYEGPERESREIRELSGSYSIETMCPDGSCVIISKLDSDEFYRLDLDSTLTLLPYKEIIGSISIP